MDTGNTSGIWDANWAEPPSLKEMQFNVYQESLSVKFAKIDRSVKRRFESYEGLQVLELGAGLGTYSILFGQRGAKVSLLDYSQNALEGAVGTLKHFNIPELMIKRNALTAASEIDERYDVVMSFGLVEHFDGSERQQIINSHRQLTKGSGLSIIEAPNRYCIPYRLWKLFLELRGRWRLGLEKPFSRGELRKRGKRAGFRSLEIHGAPLKGYESDFRAHIWNFVTYKFGLVKDGYWLSYQDKLQPQKESQISNYFGRSLILIGSNWGS